MRATTDIDEADAGAAEDLLDAGVPAPRRRKATPERRCIVTRAVQSPDAMIRFVRDPQGVVVPDLKAVLPGRGAWVTADARHVAEAVRRRAFPRAFRGEAHVPDDLAGTVALLLEARAVEGLAMANKAGAVVAGAGKVDEAARKGHILGLLHALEASRPEATKLDALARAVARDRGFEVTVSYDLTSEMMGLALGRLHVIHAALLGDAGARAPGASRGQASRMALERIALLARYRGSVDP